MKQYVGCLVINAEPMVRGDYTRKYGCSDPSKEHPMDEGYLIVYFDGVPRWASKAEFESICYPIDGMTFGQAIEMMKQGKKVTRLGWNGKKMYLWLKEGTKIKSDWCHDPALKAIADNHGGEIEALGTICMKTADDKILTGWLASQTDMLSTDWTIAG